MGLGTRLTIPMLDLYGPSIKLRNYILPVLRTQNAQAISNQRFPLTVFNTTYTNSGSHYANQHSYIYTFNMTGAIRGEKVKNSIILHTHNEKFH